MKKINCIFTLLSLTWFFAIANTVIRYAMLHTLPENVQIYAANVLYSPWTFLIYALFFSFFGVATFAIVRKLSWRLVPLILAIGAFILLQVAFPYYVQTTLDASTSDAIMVFFGILLGFVMTASADNRSNPKMYWWLLYAMIVLFILTSFVLNILAAHVADSSLNPTLTAFRNALTQGPMLDWTGDFALYLFLPSLYGLFFRFNPARYGILISLFFMLISDFADVGTRWDALNSAIGVIGMGFLAALIFSSPLLDLYQANKINLRKINGLQMGGYFLIQSILVPVATLVIGDLSELKFNIFFYILFAMLSSIFYFRQSYATTYRPGVHLLCTYLLTIFVWSLILGVLYLHYKLPFLIPLLIVFGALTSITAFIGFSSSEIFKRIRSRQKYTKLEIAD